MKTAAQLVGRERPEESQDFDIEKASLADVVSFVEKRSVIDTNVLGTEIRTVTAPWITMRTLSTAWVGPVPDAPSDKTVVRFVVVSGEEARDDKDLHVDGIDFSGYDANPVWLYSHQWEMPPIGRCLKRQIFKRGSTYELWKDIEFTPADLYPFGHQIGQMHSRGWMRACSGGWLGTRIKVQRARDGSPERIVYLSSDWMETSSCSVGIDKFALQEAVERGFVDSSGADIIARFAPSMPVTRTYDIRSNKARSFKPEAGRVLVEEKNLDNPYEEEWMRAMKARPEPIASVSSRAAHEPTDMIKCPKCGAENAPGTTTCSECGGDLTSERAVDSTTCPECGSTVKSGQTDECPECGATLASETEMKDQEVKSAEMEERKAKATKANDKSAKSRSSDEEATTRRVIELAALRGPIAQALDTAYDQLFSNTVTLAQICDELRGLSSGAFYEGRAFEPDEIDRASVERQFRASFERQLPTMVSRTLEVMATSSTPELDVMVTRQVDRGEACVSRLGNALSDIRDAVGLYVEDTGPMDITERAGRKIATGRRAKINVACVGMRSALRSLEEVLAEEDPLEAGPDAEGVVEDASETMDSAVSTISNETRSRIDAIVNRRDDANSITERAARLRDRLALALEGGEKPQRPDRLASPLPGVRVPLSVASRIGLPKNQ